MATCKLIIEDEVNIKLEGLEVDNQDLENNVIRLCYVNDSVNYVSLRNKINRKYFFSYQGGRLRHEQRPISRVIFNDRRNDERFLQ